MALDWLGGTMQTLFRIGKGGPQLKSNAGALETRDPTDSAFAIHRVATPVGNDDAVTKGYCDAQSAPASIRSIRRNFTQVTGTVESTKEIPANAHVHRTVVVVEVPFDGAGSSITVGRTSNATLLQTAAMNDPEAAEQYGNPTIVEWGGTPDGVLVTVVDGGGNAGSGYVLVEYSTPDV